MENTFAIDIIPPNDSERIAALHRYRMLDTPRETVFDNMTCLASEIFELPIALISLVDAEMVFYKSTVGVGNMRCKDRGESLCSLAILSEELTVFEDTFDAPVLAKNPVVHGAAGVRFYAGAPLRTPDGFLIGIICVAGQQPRLFTDHDRQVLEKLSKVVMEQMELRLTAMNEVEAQRQLSEQKQEFISVASHELWTPVTSLTACLQLLERMKAEANPALGKLLDQANRSLIKLNKLITDLLDVNRIGSGNSHLNKTKFNLSELINHCCTHIRHTGTHNLFIDGDMDLQIFADEHKIDQVVVNLANNAVKYAPNAPDIHIHISREADFARVSVRDEGPGIPCEQQPYLFERYYRAAGTKSSGLGLGLYISAQIIRQHGGHIGVDSEPGKGSTFWFTLPLN